MTGARALLDELRPHIHDERVLAAIAAVPRTAFVPAEPEGEAWANQALAIGCGQTISQPLVVARMAELLDVRPGDRVLDVGTGSGYHAAILAALGGHVWSVERHAELSAAAARALAAAGVRGVELVVGDGSDGLPAHGPVRRDQRRGGDARGRPARPSRRSSPRAAGWSPPSWAAAAGSGCALRARARAASCGRRSRRSASSRSCGTEPAQPGSACASETTSAKRSPCSSTRAQDLGGGEDQRLGVAARAPWRAPRPRSPASRPWAAPARAASRRDTVVLAASFWLQSTSTLPGAGAWSSARRPAPAPRARAARPRRCANAFVSVVASRGRRAGRRPAAPSSPRSWGSSAGPARRTSPPAAAATRQHSTTVAGSPGSRSKASVVGVLEVLDPRERRVQLEVGEVGQPHERRARPRPRRTRSPSSPSGCARSRTHGGPVRGRVLLVEELARRRRRGSA